jgi:hypothetical protein
LLIGIGVLWIVGFVFSHFRLAGKRRAARDWPTTPGRVLRSEVVVEERAGGVDEPDVTVYRPVIEYSYQAGGAERRGARVRYGLGVRDERVARRMVGTYPVGAQPPVFVNPHNPDDAVLETGGGGFPILLVMAAGGLVFIAVGMAFARF